MSNWWVKREQAKLDARIWKEYLRVTDAKPKEEWFDGLDHRAWRRWASPSLARPAMVRGNPLATRWHQDFKYKDNAMDG